MEPNKPQTLYTVRYTIKRDQIVDFVNELHTIQLEMLEAALVSKEKQGFPDANVVIDHIKSL